MKYKFITLNNGKLCPTLGFGVAYIKGNTVIDSVIKAIETGYRLIDTAALYRNEKEVGIAIKKCIESGIVQRQDLFITSKAPFFNPGYQETIDGYYKSLENLQMEYLDLYLLHHPFMQYANFQEHIARSYDALEYLYKNQKVKNIGVSNFWGYFCEVLYNYAEVVPQVNQIELHPYNQDRDTVKFCVEHKTQIQSWGGANQGRLFDSQIMQEIGKRYDKTVVQVAIRWNIQKGNSVLVRSTNTERIKENYDVFDFELTQEEISMIDKLDGTGVANRGHGIVSLPVMHHTASTLSNEIVMAIKKNIPKPKRKQYKLFGFLPLLVLHIDTNSTKVYLFGIRILKITKQYR